MAAPFNPAEYASAPTLSASNAVPLVRTLLMVAPRGAPPSVRGPQRQMRELAEQLRAARLAKRKRRKAVDLRAVDQFADASVGRLFRRLEDYSKLPPERHPLAARAEELLDAIFPEGLGFLSAKMDAQWNATEELLHLIDTEGLQADVDRIAGAEFLAEVRLAHAEYGKALGITAPKAPQPAAAPNLLALLRELTAVMGEYLFQMAALASSQATAPELRAAARDALAPVDDFRRRAARKGDAPAPEEDDDAEKPLPDAPND